MTLLLVQADLQLHRVLAAVAELCEQEAFMRPPSRVSKPLHGSDLRSSPARSIRGMLMRTKSPTLAYDQVHQFHSRYCSNCNILSHRLHFYYLVLWYASSSLIPWS
ncbi:7583_t:CDS:1 [Paraglomus brasilianum]|uniref:7583_t:CDS:1 n=1 Tax=Paraglomus brasilianum TaxID=144538 RepID=A0A9N8ZXA9_9GLOM|nr:7583_t:CDS:1 [Paraglomus brasilianum]